MQEPSSVFAAEPERHPGSVRANLALINQHLSVSRPHLVDVVKGLLR